MHAQTFVVFGLLAAASAAQADELTTNQQSAGCSMVEGALSCPSPGAGRCWAKDHDPALDQPPAVIDVGLDPASPDHGHAERCSGFAPPISPGDNPAFERGAFDSGKPATSPLPTVCRAGRCLIETVEATDVALADRKGVLVRAYNQNWTFDVSRPAAKTRDPDSVSYVFCARTHPAVIEPVRAGGRLILAFLVPEDRNFYNHANERELAEYFAVCHARMFGNLFESGPAFARAIGYHSVMGDVQHIVDRPEDIFEFTN